VGASVGDVEEGSVDVERNKQELHCKKETSPRSAKNNNELSNGERWKRRT